MPEHADFAYTACLNLIIGIVLGIIFHRSDFCMAGMFRDVFLFRQTFFVRILCLQVTITMTLFFLARESGLINFYPPPNLTRASLGTLIGGSVFGAGMVLAGGCVIGTLYKMGAGSVTGIIAFTGLILGSGIYAELYPVWTRSLEKAIASKAVLLPQLVHSDSLVPVVLLVALLQIFRWIRRGMLFQKAHAEGYLHPWKAAVFIAFLNLALYAGSGMPLAVSTGYAKLAAYLEKSAFPVHYETLAFFKKESFAFVDPDTGGIVAGGPGAKIDHIFSTEVALMLGVVAGSFASALFLKEFRIRNLPPPVQGLSALFGGILLAIGSRMAGGCNIKFLMSGLPLLSIQAVVFLLGMLPGVMAGNYLLKNWVIRIED
ncbi:MAG TPA: YeeE/YedE family protein [Dissulfurispiraceae bacterium]